MNQLMINIREFSPNLLKLLLVEQTRTRKDEQVSGRLKGPNIPKLEILPVMQNLSYDCIYIGYLIQVYSRMYSNNQYSNPKRHIQIFYYFHPLIR